MYRNERKYSKQMRLAARPRRRIDVAERREVNPRTDEPP